MLKFSLNKLRIVAQFGALIMVSLGLLPGGANAATVANVLASGPQTVVDDQGTDGNTKMAINLLETTGIWLEMNASPTQVDEGFQISLFNSTGEDITDLWFEVVKPGGEGLGTNPTLTDWESSVSSSQSGGIAVFSKEFVADETARQRFHLQFNPPLSSVSGNLMLISLSTFPGFGDWVGFNTAGGNWWLNIDWNTEDNNRPGGGTPAEPVPNVTANASDGPLTLQSGENVTIDITFDAGDSAGTDADWWAVASNGIGWFQYKHPTGWVSIGTNLDLNTVQPAHQGKLANVSSPLNLFSASNLQEGSYWVYFGIDKNMNGKVDQDTLIFDSVQFDIQ